MKKLLLCALFWAMSIANLNAEKRLSEEQFYQLSDDCLNNENKNACQRLIDYGLASVEQCDKENCAYIGFAYDNVKNHQQALKYYQKAAELGDAKGYYNLAVSYEKGEGVKQNFVSARNYYEKACNANYAFACNNLGALYGKGQGVKQNFSSAKKFFGKACDLGDEMGCDNYKILNEQGVK